MVSPDKKSRAMALSALLARNRPEQPQAGDSPRGTRPDTDELWNWMHNEVNATRAVEIRSHLAFDADLYESWRQLRLAQAELAMPDTAVAGITATTAKAPAIDRSSRQFRWPDWLHTWRWPVAGGAGAALAVTLMGVLVLRPTTNPTPGVEFWDQWQTAKSAAGRALDIDERASLQRVIRGMREQLDTQGLPTLDANGEELPASDCRQISTCELHEAALHELGSQITALRLQCLRRQPLTAELLLDLQTSAQRLAQHNATRLIAAPLRTLSGAAAGNETDTVAVCNTADVVIERVLMAR